ncbi:MAG: efflux RND transporter periplasmic adaptor subunit [Desulfobacterales bacterium]|nr:efflux RND transporter periplasmic adaptor subunit [Desulfobacterales bacterium]
MADNFFRKILFPALCLSFLHICGCGDKAETDVNTKPALKEAIKVKVSQIKALAPRGTIEYVGVLTARLKVNVDSETGGTIEKLHFERGQHIKKNQSLAEIGTDSIRLEVRMADAALKEAVAALLEAESNYKRVKNLHEINAVADSEFDSAKKMVEMARANKGKAKAALALARDQLRKSRLIAPCNGIIAFRDVEIGEVIPPGRTITQVVNLDRLKIKASLSEKDVHILEKQRRFAFTIDAIPGEEFFCQMYFMSPTADPATRSFPIELTVEQADKRMADGMTARVEFPLVDEKKSIKVHSAWLSEENGNMGLYIVEDGKAIFKKVSLGAYYDQRVEILSGLNGQELVITNPAGLKNNAPVTY